MSELAAAWTGGGLVALGMILGALFLAWRDRRNS